MILQPKKYEAKMETELDAIDSMRREDVLYAYAKKKS
jgi:hypothetical protein